MIEKLFSLEIPAGFVNNGTTFQSRGRWIAGNLVRFFQKNRQPIGGWVQRTLTGATITGTPNAAISWQTNAGTSWLAIGTTTGLWVVDTSNVVYDITPEYSVADTPPYQWQLDTFGTYLIATLRRAAYLDTFMTNVSYWAGDPSFRATFAYQYDFGPGSAYGTVTTPERFLVVLRGASPQTAAGDGWEWGSGKVY